MTTNYEILTDDQRLRMIESRIEELEGQVWADEFILMEARAIEDRTTMRDVPIRIAARKKQIAALLPLRNELKEATAETEADVAPSP